jgi:hypothetical protein
MLCALGAAVISVAFGSDQPALVAEEPKVGGGTG